MPERTSPGSRSWCVRFRSATDLWAWITSQPVSAWQHDLIERLITRPDQRFYIHDPGRYRRQMHAYVHGLDLGRGPSVSVGVSEIPIKDSEVFPKNHRCTFAIVDDPIDDKVVREAAQRVTESVEVAIMSGLHKHGIRGAQITSA